MLDPSQCHHGAPHTNLPPSLLRTSGARSSPTTSSQADLLLSAHWLFAARLVLSVELSQNAAFVMKNSIWALYGAATHAHNYNSLELGQIPFLLSDRKINLSPSVAAIDIKLRYSSSHPPWLQQPSVNQGSWHRREERQAGGFNSWPQLPGYLIRVGRLFTEIIGSW